MKKYDGFRFGVIVLIYGVVLLFFGQNAIATVTDEGIGFSYRNIIPQNQLQEGNFFDLLVKPNQKQTLLMEVTNESQEEIELEIEINDSKTTSMGEITYESASTLAHTLGLTYHLSDLLIAPRTLTLQEGESKIVEMILKTPAEKFEGVILGGVQLRKKVPNIKQEGVVNHYKYTYSVSLRMDQEPLSIKLSHNPTQYVHENGELQVILSINNDTQEIAKNLTIGVEVTAQNNQKVLYEYFGNELKMAPFSIMEIPLNDLPIFSVGNYTAKMNLKMGSQSWHWEDEFIVKDEAVEQLQNVKMASQKKLNHRPLIIGMILIAIFTLGLYVIFRLWVNK